MTRPFELDDPLADERDIRLLSDESGMAAGQVRDLFRHELARLGMGAKVGLYVAVLTASNVRGMLRRRARQPENARARHAGVPPREQSPRALRRQVQSWEDDGGSVRRAIARRSTNDPFLVSRPNSTRRSAARASPDRAP